MEFLCTWIFSLYHIFLKKEEGGGGGGVVDPLDWLVQRYIKLSFIAETR